MDIKRYELRELGRVFTGIGIGMMIANYTLVPSGDNRGYFLGGILIVLGLLLSELNVRRSS